MSVSKGQKLAAASSVFLVAEPALAFAHLGGIGAIVGGIAGIATYVYADEIASMVGVGRGTESQQPAPTPRKAAGSHSMAYRLLNGKSVRGEVALADTAQQASSFKGQKGQQDIWIPPLFKLDADTLALIEAFNQRGCVYFGDSEGGAIAINLNDMYHVLDVSSSGKGKSNRFRLAMMQMVGSCETYYINPLAAAVKPVSDNREIEVWQPIYNHLANKRPMKTGDEIAFLMTALVNEITRRNELEEQRDFSWMGSPIFVFIDELPEVFKRCPQALEMLDTIGRTGRQFRVFCWVASQTAQVSDIGLSTAAQAQFMTRIYGGGDQTSANRLMKGGVSVASERALQASGAGLTLMLAAGISGCTFVRAPLVMSEMMFTYLGLPFNKADWLPQQPRKLAGVTQRNALDYHAQRNEIAGANNAQKMPLRPDGEPSQQTQKNAMGDARSGTGAQKMPSRPGGERPQRAQHAATEPHFRYRLSNKQINQIFALWPLHVPNKDDALKQVGAHTGYRSHFNYLIQQREECHE